MGLPGCRWVHLVGVPQLLDGGGDKQSLEGIGQRGIDDHWLVALLPIGKQKLALPIGRKR